VRCPRIKIMRGRESKRPYLIFKIKEDFLHVLKPLPDHGLGGLESLRKLKGYDYQDRNGFRRRAVHGVRREAQYLWTGMPSLIDYDIVLVCLGLTEVNGTDSGAELELIFMFFSFC
jgi:hypothetical protein